MLYEVNIVGSKIFELIDLWVLRFINGNKISSKMNFKKSLYCGQKNYYPTGQNLKYEIVFIYGWSYSNNKITKLLMLFEACKEINQQPC